MVNWKQEWSQFHRDPPVSVKRKPIVSTFRYRERWNAKNNDIAQLPSAGNLEASLALQTPDNLSNPNNLKWQLLLLHLQLLVSSTGHHLRIHLILKIVNNCYHWIYKDCDIITNNWFVIRVFTCTKKIKIPIRIKARARGSATSSITQSPRERVRTDR